MDSYKFMDGVYVYFVTFTLVDWLPLFKYPEPIKIITDSLRFCIMNKFLKVHAYVIMPNHIHLVISDANLNNSRLQETLTAFRKFTGHQLANYIDKTFPESLAMAIHNKTINDRNRQVWQPGWHAEGLVSDSFFHQKVNYIHENPVRKGYVRLPEDWVYSSAGYWINGKEGEIPVTLDIKDDE
jgi:REP element-mobilizing transposase RayT